MALRPLRDEKEIAAVPLDQPVMIELPDGIDGPPLQPEQPKSLQDQLDAALEAQKQSRERAERAERAAEEARLLAQRRTNEAEQYRQRSSTLESDVIDGGLKSAQNDLAAAEAELQRAGEAGDYGAMAKAQARIGRASAQIVHLEGGAAELAERKAAPVQRNEAPPQMSWSDSVMRNNNLMNSEKSWMLAHEADFRDPDFNRKLEFAYQGAMGRGLVRGTPDYFEHIERATGLRAQARDDRSDERDIPMSAPVSRNERSARPGSTTSLTLTPEQREFARNLGISDVEYARQVQALDRARQEDPERYSVYSTRR